VRQQVPRSGQYTASGQLKAEGEDDLLEAAEEGLVDIRLLVNAQDFSHIRSRAAVPGSIVSARFRRCGTAI
jgi:hypothetical protein